MRTRKFGSGRRREVWPDHRLIERHPRVCVLALARDGGTVAGVVTTLRWTNGFVATIRAEPTRLIIETADRRQMVALDPKRCGFLVRAGMLCPACSRRCVHLIENGGIFSCRLCCGLDHSSRHVHRRRWSALGRIAKLRGKIKADPSPLSPLPPRPRWNTAAAKYDRVAAEIERQEAILIGRGSQWTKS
ncbi:hypothetical protein [Bradyrhizobium sp. Ai1a-2]|uniref:hypothetical protein n=1 Tax=Bradyrhizobium sp. Ai1a-2 TaxID=196490 RepID=UPI00048298B1|nr:hypothetical protein [Bradyrhizobium sp. Ai1a-2]